MLDYKTGKSKYAFSMCKCRHEEDEDDDKDCYGFVEYNHINYGEAFFFLYEEKLIFLLLFVRSERRVFFI